MIGDEALARRLDGFLATRRATRQSILAALDQPFGPPLLVVATGSVLHGVGNRCSDLDVNVVVDAEVTGAPVGSYARELLVDAAYFGAGHLREWAPLLRASAWPPAGRLDRAQWFARRSLLLNCVRFGHGLTLCAQDGWREWKDTFAEPWLLDVVAQWWRIEAVRKRVAARWLSAAKPLLAAQRQFEAVLAALEARAASAGLPFFGAKWVPEKLRALDDAEGSRALRRVIRLPIREGEAHDYLALCDDVLAELSCPPAAADLALHAQLSFLPGVARRAVDGQVILSRWNLRAVELGRAGKAVATPPALLWDAPVDVEPPPAVLACFVADMTWLSVSRASAT